MAITLETPALHHEREFLAAVRRSRTLHRGRVSPPSTPGAYRRYLERVRDDRFIGYFVRGPERELAGVVDLSEVVRGRFSSAYLAFYAFTPHAGHGLMRSGLERVVQRAFRAHRLHRLEANIQPDNARSISLVKSLGFRREGFSPRYLKVGGRWRDHERWAITAEEWFAR